MVADNRQHQSRQTVLGGDIQGGSSFHETMYQLRVTDCGGVHEGSLVVLVQCVDVRAWLKQGYNFVCIPASYGFVKWYIHCFTAFDILAIAGLKREQK